MTPHLQGDREGSSEEGSPEDGLKDERGLAPKGGVWGGRGELGRRREGYTLSGGSSGEPQGYRDIRAGAKELKQVEFRRLSLPGSYKDSL